MQLVSFLPLLSMPYSFLFVASGAFLIKSYILAFLVSQGKRLPYPAMYNPWLFFVTIVGCGAFIDLSWVIKLLSTTYVPTLDYRFVVLVVRLAWVIYILQRVLTVLFLKYMTDKNYRLTIQDKLLILVSSVVALYFVILAFTDFGVADVQVRCAYMLTDPLEVKIRRYCVYFLDLLTIIYACLIMNSPFYAALPSFMKRRVRTFVFCFILPYAISTTLSTLKLFYNLEIDQVLIYGPYTIQIFSTLITTAALVYCVRRFMSFLGMSLLVPREPSERRRL